MKQKFTFIDLFSGIGGFHKGVSMAGGKCLMASDIDLVANQTYYENYGIKPKGDICKIQSAEIPDFDLLCGGFPCQPFSNVGQKGGLEDLRGQLIYEVFRILNDKKPKAFILENVKGLSAHSKGAVLELILENLKRVGYRVSHTILEAKDFGTPQLRKRLFFVGIREDINATFNFPQPIPLKYSLSEIMKGNTEREYAFTIRIGGRRSGIKNRYNWDCYMVNGEPRYITVEECLLLQGFERDFKVCGNNSQQFAQVGNSVPVTIVNLITQELVKAGVL